MYERDQKEPLWVVPFSFGLSRLLRETVHTQIGDRQINVAPGAFLFGPRGVPHTFKNVGTNTGRVLVIIAPPGLEKFFEEADQLGKAGPPPVEKLIELARKYELEFLPPKT